MPTIDTSTSTIEVPSVETPESSRLYVDAYARCESEMLALDPRTFVTINLDVPSVVTVALNAIGKIRTFRPRIEDRLRDFDFERFDKLEDYTRALAQAHAMSIAAAAPTGTLVELNQEAIKIREALVADAVSLSRHGYIDPTRLDDLSGATGYKNVAFDLLAMVGLFHESWSEVAPHTPVKLADLRQAARIADGIIELLGAREAASAKAAHAAEMRVRAFTLFMNAYDDARSAVTYLRWREGDADSFAPSVYTVRKNARKRDSADAVAPDGGEGAGSEFTPTPSTEIVAAPAGVTAPTPQLPSAATPVPPAAQVVVPTNPDMPGASPFVS